MTRNVQWKAADPAFAASSRYRVIDGRFLVTSQTGQYAFLDPAQFQAYVQGSIEPDSELYRSLAEKNLIRSEAAIDELARQLARRKRFLDHGPHLHIVEVTLRCNQTCVYCHSSRADLDDTDRDMTLETADKVVDMIFETTSPEITIEFQGGEPLVNFPVVRRVIEKALEKNRTAGKTVSFSLVTNLSAMDQEKLAFLIDRRVQICTSIDGPGELHNKQRILAGGDAYSEAEKWIRRINQAYADDGLDPDIYHVEGLLTTTRQVLDRPQQVVDTYRSLGFRALFLRPVDPFGFASGAAARLGYSPREFLDFYRRAVDYMIELSLQNVQILERYAAIFLTKILVGEDPNFLDLRSPCGAGIGQVAYGYGGEIFTCDEARMLHHMGDSFFQIGNVTDTTYDRAMRHDTVRAMTVASTLDASADCANCVYNPYCGICPVYNYAMQGGIHGQLRTSAWCAIVMGIQDYLFGKILAADPRVMEVFDRWMTVRPRDHYLHGGDPQDHGAG